MAYCPAADKQVLQRVINTGQRIVKSQLPEIEGIYSSHCLRKAFNIIKDSSHFCHHLFAMLPSGEYYQTSRVHNSRLMDSFNLKAFTTLNIALPNAPSTPTLPHPPESIPIHLHITPPLTSQSTPWTSALTDISDNLQV